MNDSDDHEIGIYRSVIQDILTGVAEAEVLVHLLRSHHVTANANSVTLVFLDD